jgi:hypothetical protein
MMFEMLSSDRRDPLHSEVGFVWLYRPSSIGQGLGAMEAMLNRAVVKVTKLALTVTDAPAGN